MKPVKYDCNSNDMTGTLEKPYVQLFQNLFNGIFGKILSTAPTDGSPFRTNDRDLLTPNLLNENDTYNPSNINYSLQRGSN